MAFLIPQNIPSRNDLPGRLRTVAGALRDFLPEEITVWLERPGSGDRTALALEFDIDHDPEPSPLESEPYLVLFDPAAGIAVLEAPSPRSLGLGQRRRIARRRKLDLTRIQNEVEKRIGKLRHELHASNRRQTRSLPIKRVIALPDVSRKDASAFDGALGLLTKEDFEQENLWEALHRVLGGQRPNLAEKDQSAVRAVVNPRIVIGERADNGQKRFMFDPPALADPNQVIAVLDRRQERLAMSLGPGYRVIRGVAGSGKTLVLTYRAQYIAEHFPSSRILLLCFNGALSVALRKEVKKYRNIKVQTVDKLAADLLKQISRQMRQLRSAEEWRERRVRATEVAGGLGDSEKYNMVLVDEAQDLEGSHLDLAYAMLKPGKDHFVMALDSAQNIYRRRMKWNPPGMTARGRSTILRRNYRNTREILGLAVELLMGVSRKENPAARPDDLDALVMPEAAERSGKLPLLQVCGDRRREATEIARLVEKKIASGVNSGDIVVLSGSKDFRDHFQRALEKKGIRSFDAQLKGNRDRAVVVQNKVRIATLQLFKGIEFPHIFIGGANDTWVPGPDGPQQLEAVKRLLYVAITRATETLTITFSGEGPITQVLQAAQRL